MSSDGFDVQIATLTQRLQDHIRFCEDQRMMARNFYRWTITLVLGGLAGLAGWAWHLDQGNDATIQFLIERLYACQQYWPNLGPP